MLEFSPNILDSIRGVDPDVSRRRHLQPQHGPGRGGRSRSGGRGRGAGAGLATMGSVRASLIWAASLEATFTGYWPEYSARRRTCPTRMYVHTAPPINNRMRIVSVASHCN